MKRQLIWLSVALLGLFSCSKDKARIDINLKDAPGSELVVTTLNVNKRDVVDTVKTNKSGKASLKVVLPYASPNFYYISYKGNNLASLLVSPSDKVKVEVDTNGQNLSVSGSAESELLQKVNADITRSQYSFDSLTVLLLQLSDTDDGQRLKNIRTEMGRLYVKQKQKAIRHLIANPFSFTNLRYLYRQFNDNFPLFAELTDGVYYKQLADSLKTVYPKSPYVASLENDVQRFFNEMELSYRVSEAPQTVYPELALPDVNAEVQTLSSLLGHPFILLFWDQTDNTQKMFKAELESIYNQFSGRGLKIYSVGVTTDKTFWNSIVKRFSWINVCDGKGSLSASLKTYNVTKLPTLFVFDKEGRIVKKDVFDKAGLSSAVSSVCQ